MSWITHMLFNVSALSTTEPDLSHTHTHTICVGKISGGTSTLKFWNSAIQKHKSSFFVHSLGFLSNWVAEDVDVAHNTTPHPTPYIFISDRKQNSYNDNRLVCKNKQNFPSADSSLLESESNLTFGTSDLLLASLSYHAWQNPHHDLNLKQKNKNIGLRLVRGQKRSEIWGGFI